MRITGDWLESLGFESYRERRFERVTGDTPNIIRVVLIAPRSNDPNAQKWKLRISSLKGDFEDLIETRAEFMGLVN